MSDQSRGQEASNRGTMGLPTGVSACLFDLDGVLTNTAAVHNRAWTDMFDAYLRERGERTGEQLEPFDPDRDYGEHVDGKPREDGVRDFLSSRGIHLPEGSPNDPTDAETIAGLGNRKNKALMAAIDRDGVEVFDDARSYLESARDAGLRRAVVSSSANTRHVLSVTGLADLVEEVIDGTDVIARHLRGKPAPDGFLAGAHALGVAPGAAAVFEDALAGVEAGRAGSFGLVVGVDRLGHGHGADLALHGADVVVTQLTQLLAGPTDGPTAGQTGGSGR